MRLADFIDQDQERILVEWEAFAATMLPAANHMAPRALRDHAPQILRAVARDLRTHQSIAQQARKAKGRVEEAPGAAETAAQSHAVLRAKSGFDIMQLVAEYRALRASVLRLWARSGPRGGPRGVAAFDDMIRFNEAIDQAVAESIAYFDAEVERSRNLLLGTLGHDMRSPLSTIVTSAAVLTSLHESDEALAAAARVRRGAASIRVLLDDLTSISQSRLGAGLSVNRAPVDLAKVIHDEVDQMRGAYPLRIIGLSMSGDTVGEWDGARLQQLVRNLVSNALQYGDASAAVRVTLCGDETDIELDVSNAGPEIHPIVRATMFEPLSRGAADGEGLGLGLYIVRAIADAHSGDVSVATDARETTFRVRLPRRAQN
jgi:signal transduction histidine kinase